MKNKYYSLVQLGDEATINIYGDITSWPWEEIGDVSAYNLSKQLDEMQNVKQINVHISSYGGEVKEGLAIYNALKNNPAKVVTYCDSFACSIASVIFMAGDERLMSKASLLMIHNAWTYAEGNAEELRKQADDLEVITSASIEAYNMHTNIGKNKIKKLMDAESWIKPSDAVTWGFATGILEDEKADNPVQSIKEKLVNIVMAAQAGAGDGEDGEQETAEGEEEKPSEGEKSGSDEQQGEAEGNSEAEMAEQAENDMVFGFFNAII